ncbi:MAG: hypothetical protein IPQ24_02745 [Anaeromyxobacter sp.]|nr:hypothetical protein [Anaeromyxobacter sp.]
MCGEHLDPVVAAARCVASHDYRGALDILHGGLSRAPKDPWLMLRLGSLYGRTGRPQLASDWFAHAAELLERSGMYRQAGLAWLHASRHDPRRIRSAIRFADRVYCLGSLSGAAAVFNGLPSITTGVDVPTQADWFWVAVPIALETQSDALACQIVENLLALTGVEIIFHLLRESEATVRLGVEGQACAARCLLALGSSQRRAEEFRGRVERQVGGGSVAAPGTPSSVRVYDPLLAPEEAFARGLAVRAAARVEARGSGASAARHPGARAHKPSPWQIPASFDARPMLPEPPLPREWMVRLPSLFRRYAQWLEHQGPRQEPPRRAGVRRPRAAP